MRGMAYREAWEMSCLASECLALNSARIIRPEGVDPARGQYAGQYAAEVAARLPTIGELGPCIAEKGSRRCGWSRSGPAAQEQSIDDLVGRLNAWRTTATVRSAARHLPAVVRPTQRSGAERLDQHSDGPACRCWTQRPDVAEWVSPFTLGRLRPGPQTRRDGAWDRRSRLANGWERADFGGSRRWAIECWGSGG